MLLTWTEQRQQNPTQVDPPAGHPPFSSSSRGPWTLPTGILECRCLRSCPRAPTYPGEGPEALEDGSVARAATQVSCGPRDKAALSAQAPGAGEGLVTLLLAQLNTHFTYSVFSAWNTLSSSSYF